MPEPRVSIKLIYKQISKYITGIAIIENHQFSKSGFKRKSINPIVTIPS